MGSNSLIEHCGWRMGANPRQDKPHLTKVSSSRYHGGWGASRRCRGELGCVGGCMLLFKSIKRVNALIFSLVGMVKLASIECVWLL